MSNTEALWSAFQRDGFVVLRGFAARAQLEAYRNELARLAELAPTLPREHFFYEDKSDPTTLKQIQKLTEHSPLFNGAADGEYKTLASQALGDDVRMVNVQYFNKPPGVGRPTPPHQDGYYFMLDPCEAVTMWLALDEVDEQNGCVRYLPGSHREGMRPHARTETLGFSQGISDYEEADREREVAVSAAPGDLLIHHAMTIHRADGNRSSSRSRRALGWVYYRSDAKQDQAAHAAYQKRLKREMLDRGRI